MRITRLLLRNYRVYEDEVEIEVPAGLVGVYGPNGAGKSYLIESIPWTLFGVSRTNKDDVRTSGVNGECVTELEFEHEGHLYMVRRTITGQNHTVRAEAHADRAQVAEGVRDTNAYVQSILGMDVAAFKASVFAEQKQIASFSSETPAKRRDLVLRLLGIMPLDIARDNAKRDARQKREAHDQARKMLPDIVVLQSAAEAAATLASDARPARDAAELFRDAQARTEVTAAETTFAALDGVRQQHEKLVAEGKAVAAERSAATKQMDGLEAELGALAAAQQELAGLVPVAARLDVLEHRLSLVRRVVEAESERARLPALPAVAPAPPDEAALEQAQNDSSAHSERLAAIQGQIAALQTEHGRVNDALTRSRALTGEADCPMCGQPLGDSYVTVRTHREAELAEVGARLKLLDGERAALAKNVADAKRQAADRSKSINAARQAFAAFEKLNALHDTAVARIEQGRRALEADGHVEAAGAPVGLDAQLDPQLDALTAKVAESRAAEQTVALLQGRLQRRDEAQRSLNEQRAIYERASSRRDALLGEVRALAYDPAQLAKAVARRDAARAQAAAASAALQQAEIALATAATRADAARQALDDGLAQHVRLDLLADDARHVSRLADLLGTFRNAVVSTVGPTLAAHAAGLFADLTDREYDQLEVDPDTYEIRITDAGRTYGMGRFSGSETDLANLALRVAISENVRLQSGGAVGLLVLDEIFGPLDDERRERMLFALERLKARFRQVMVVTHNNDIKDQLPSAIEVVKRPGRRATARVLVGA